MSLRSFSVGKSVMKPTPDRPAQRLCQNEGTSFPTGVTTPSPVTATLRGFGGLPQRDPPMLGGDPRLDLAAQIADGGQLDQVLVGDDDVELGLELADDLHHREGVDP